MASLKMFRIELVEVVFGSYERIVNILVVFLAEEYKNDELEQDHLKKIVIFKFNNEWPEC